MRSRTGALALIVALAGLIAACGSGGGPRRVNATATATTSLAGDARPGATPRTPARPPTAAAVELKLELPLVGLSSAPTVRFTTTQRYATLRGAVKPATATVYLLAPSGNRTAVIPKADGSFRVRVPLTPGTNSFRFTAARLGAADSAADLDVTWQGRSADAMRALVRSDPVKYLPPASAGLNRKLPPLGNLAALVGAGGHAPTLGRVTVTFSLDPISAGPPPASGGPGQWLSGFELTEYYPALEAWFTGAPVDTPGLSSEHRIDWLYSARGVSMEGDGVGLDGRQYHIQGLGSGGWVTPSTAPASFSDPADAPFWRSGGFWKSAGGALTFPLNAGGWAHGVGVSYVPPPSGISFAPGPSNSKLRYLRSIAVDPSVIPMGSHVYIPGYKSVNGGWFEADDTGGAIIGRHIDVFRPPPSNPSDAGIYATGANVYVVPPGQPLP